MSCSKDAKLFAMGDDDLNRWINWIFVACIVGLLIDVATIFWSAYRNATNNSRRQLIHKRQIWLFIALALLSLFVVNAIKVNYQMFKYTSWNEVHREYKKIKKGFPGEVKFGKALVDAKEAVRNWSFVQRLNFHPAQFNHAEDVVKYYRDFAVVMSQRFRSMVSKEEAIPVTLRQQTADSYRGFYTLVTTDNLWDSFKTLVMSARRLWWTQQWFTAYMAWTMFVAIECYHREIRASAVLSFPLLAYVFGLAGFQSLFYILLLLKPKVSRKATWMPMKMHMLISFCGEALGLFLMRDVLHFWGVSRQGWKFNLIQLILIILPPLSQVVITIWPRVFLRHRGPMGKRAMFWTYFIMSFHMAGSLNTIFVRYAVDEGARIQWPAMSDKGQIRQYAGGCAGIAAALVNSVADHDWVSAVAFDVLFSALALCVWSVIGNLDARSMIQCGIFPWLDDEFKEPKKTTKSATVAVRQKSSDFSRRRSSAAAQETELYELREDLDRLRGRSSQSGLDGRATRSRSATRRKCVSPVKRTLSRRRTRDSPPESEVGDDVMEKFQETAGPAEAAAVAWALFTVGGLGMASTSVFGAGELR